MVIAYDHLSDEMRRDLTTALEIIKNREVLNMVSSACGRKILQELGATFTFRFDPELRQKRLLDLDILRPDTTAPKCQSIRYHIQ